MKLKLGHFLYSIFFILICYTPNIGHPLDCPPSYQSVQAKIKFTNPTRIVMFECKHEIRFEYFKSLSDTDLKVTTWASEDDILPVQKIITYKKDGIKISLQNFNREGFLDKVEKYDLEGKVIFKYLKEKSKVEELNQEERVTRICIFDEEVRQAYEEISLNPNLGTFKIKWVTADDKNEKSYKGELELKQEEVILLKGEQSPNLPEGGVLAPEQKNLSDLCMAAISEKVLFGVFAYQNQIYLIENMKLTAFFENLNLKKEDLKNFLKPYLYKVAEIKAETTDKDSTQYGQERVPNSIDSKKSKKKGPGGPFKKK